MSKSQTQYNQDEALKKFTAFATQKLRRTDGDEKTVYKLTKNNEAVLRSLLNYFARQPGELDLSKGVCLQGPVGTGKSTVMRLLGLWLGNSRPNSFRMIDCRNIQKEAAVGGFEALYKYTKQSYNYNHGFHRDNGPVTWCFDDLAQENESKHYGMEINAMQEILLDRYIENQETGMITHATTNVRDGDIFEKKYGARVRDRMRQMFNFVELAGPSFRK